MASEQKQKNIETLGLLLAGAIVSAADGAHWFAVIDRAKALDTQRTLGEMLKTWLGAEVVGITEAAAQRRRDLAGGTSTT